MIGTNELRLNEATMIEAVQEYLDKRMPTATPKVASIKSLQGSGQGLFEVQLVEPDQPA